MPDLILLDINMPELNGYQVCKALKDDETTSEIPVIFISALDSLQDKVQAFAAGGVDYITKPFQVEEVLSRVATHMALRRLQRQLQKSNAVLVESERQLAQLNVEIEERVNQRTLDLAAAYNKTIQGWAKTLELRSLEVGGHCDRVTVRGRNQWRESRGSEKKN